MNTPKHIKKKAKVEHKKSVARSVAEAMAKAKQTKKEDKPANKSNSKFKSGKPNNSKFQNSKKRKSPGDSSGHTQKKVKQERTGLKPNAALVDEMKKFWNVARMKSLTASEREALIKTIVSKMKGNILQVTLRHDASRAVQCILQFGSNAQRRQILTEMGDRISEIAKTPYGHFVILKAITYCTSDADRATVCNSLRGHFVALGTNVIGARTVESVLQLFPKKLTAPLKAEFYGHKFIAALPTHPLSLKDLLALKDKEGVTGTANVRREPILDHMRDLVQKFVDKGLLEFAYVHHLLWEYMQQCDATTAASRLNDLVALLGDSARKLVSTKPGARSMCRVVSSASAKDRKKVMKGLKGHVLECLLHEAAHLVVLRLVDVTDDTVNVQKLLLDEVSGTRAEVKYTADGKVIADSQRPPLLSVARSPFGSKLLLRLLNPLKSHLEPDESLLFVESDIAPGSSKKSPASRRKEHLAYLRSPLLTICSRYAAELLRCPYGSKVLVEVAAVFFPAMVLQKVVSIFSGQEMELPEEEEEDEEMPQREADSDSDEEEEEEEEEEADSDSEVEKEDEKEGRGGEGAVGEGDDDSNSEPEEEEEEEETVVEEEEVVLGPVEEDPVAQIALKKLLAVQLKAEEESEEAEEEASEGCRAMWESWGGDGEGEGSEEEEGDGFFPFARRLAEALASLPADSLQTWLERNRPAFVLADLMKVPSGGPPLRSALAAAPLQKQLKSSAKSTAGAKCLLSVYKASK